MGDSSESELQETINSLLTKLNLLDDAVGLLIESATSLDVQIKNFNERLEHSRTIDDNDIEHLDH